MSYETLEDYIKHLNEEEDLSQNATKIETELSSTPRTLNLTENINNVEPIQLEMKDVKRE